MEDNLEVSWERSGCQEHLMSVRLAIYTASETIVTFCTSALSNKERMVGLVLAMRLSPKSANHEPWTWEIT